MKALKKYLTKKNMLIAGGVLALGIVAFIVTRKKKEVKETKAAGGSMNEPSYINTEYSPVRGISWPLKRGSGVNTEEKLAVKVLQRYLNSKLAPPLQQLVVDGLFGVKTEAALIRIEGTATLSESRYKVIKLTPIQIG